MKILLAFVGSLCVGILFNVKKKNLVWAGLSGTLGWIAYLLFYRITGEVILPTFMGALFVGLYSEIAARAFRSPATIFSISGIFPLVPGIAAYNTIQYIVEVKLQEAAEKGVETMAAAIAIAFGIMLTSTIFKFIRELGGR
jgi:uncharacterized membrane protein YjjB (DUF3815 family)